MSLLLLLATAHAKPGDFARAMTHVEGAAPDPEPPPPDERVPPEGDFPIFGDIDWSTVDRVVKQHLNQVRYCYERRLPQRPDLEGEVTVRVLLDTDGTLLDVAVDETTLHDEAVESCLLERFSEWEWPAKREVYVVKYPFHFRKKPVPVTGT